jgi:hypothetical protein
MMTSRKYRLEYSSTPYVCVTRLANWIINANGGRRKQGFSKAPKEDPGGRGRTRKYAAGNEYCQQDCGGDAMI